MYVHPAFTPPPGTMPALLAARGFGTLVASGGETPVAVHVPFLFCPGPEGGRIELHVARVNPIHAAIAARPQVLLVCTGADAYISPDWYGSPNQVPTWNYVAVHARGTARIMAPDELEAHVDRLSAHFESRLPKTPWTSAKMDRHRFAAMLKAIVGIAVEVTTLAGQWKLGQHKDGAAHAGATAGLRALGEPGAAVVADLMDAARLPRSPP